MKKNLKFKWGTKCEQAFNDLKYRFTTALILTHFNLDFKYIVKIDFSNHVQKGTLL